MYVNKNIRVVNDATLSAIPELQFRAEAINYETIGTEGFGFTEMFSKPLTTISDILKNGIHSLKGVSFSFSSKEDYKMITSIKNIKQNVKYYNVESIKIPIMLGSKLDLLTTVNKLYDIKEHLTINTLSILNDTNTYVDMMLSNANFRKSNKPFKIDKLYMDVSNDLYNAVNDVISDNVTVDRKSVDNLIPNLDSLSTINDKLNSITSTLDSKLLKQINKAIGKIVKSVDILEKEFMAESKKGDINSNRLVELSYRIEKSAKIVTLHSSLIHIVKQTENTFKHLVETLDKK